MDPARPQGHAVVVRDGRIIEVASASDVRHLAGPGATVIDCHGKSILPGFIDPHVHLLAYASSLLSVDCSPRAVSSIDEIQMAIRERSRTLPPGQWIRATGYDEFKLAEKRHPTRWDLDIAAPYHPLRLVHRSHHASVLNSLAMALAGIGNETEEPPGGTIERDLETGEPNGVLLDMNGYLAERGLPPPLTGEELIKAISLASQAFLSRGVTFVEDASAGNDLSTLREFQRLTEAVFVPRLRMMLGIGALEDAVASGLRFGAGDDGLRLGAVKLMQRESGHKLHPAQEELNAQALAGHAAGFQVAIHATEERSVAAAVEAIAFCRKGGPGELRHRIEHCSVCPPPLQAKLHALGVVVVTQPAFLYHSGERYLAQVSPASLPWLYPMRSLLDAGVPLAASSDCPIVPPDPLLAIYAAVAREGPSGQVVGAEQALTPEEALRAHTMGAAFACFQERAAGSITPGKLADLVILSADPTGVPPQELREIGVEATIVGGEVVWQAG